MNPEILHWHTTTTTTTSMYDFLMRIRSKIHDLKLSMLNNLQPTIGNPTASCNENLNVVVVFFH